MNVLIVCSGNKGKVSAFITEQVAALNSEGIITRDFLIRGKGIRGYFSNYLRLMKALSGGEFSLIHAHYGLSGLLAALQRKVPVIITFHGSDVNNPGIHKFSRIASRLSSFNILVEESFIKKLGLKKNYAVLPCGVDPDVFRPTNKNEERQKLSFRKDETIILFSGDFKNKIKNYNLAKEAVDQVVGARLVELKGFTRPEVNSLMNAADMLLLTSFSEGSPQVIKEALACNLPIISTPVGDVPSIICNTAGNFIVNYSVPEITNAIKEITNMNKRTNGRDVILEKYANKSIANELIRIYQSVKK